MSPARRPRLEVLVTDREQAVARLHQLAGARPALRSAFQPAWQHIASGADPADLEAWASGILDLANVNAGPGCLVAAWQISVTLQPRLGLVALGDVVRAAAELCRRAGSRAAQAGLNACPTVAARLHGAGEMLQWWRSLHHLAQTAPESVALVASNVAAILEPAGLGGWQSFLSAGLKLGGTDRARRLAFFGLEDEAARRMLARLGETVDFQHVERGLKLFLTALWANPPALRIAPHGMPGSGGVGPGGWPRRTSLAGRIVLMPEVYRGVSPETARLLFRAAAAHASAHVALGAGRFPVGQLKPLQLALVGLIEDARIEALAMARFPGLRRLWAPFHTAAATGAATAPGLLARLARALFDPTYVDTDAFVVKGRALFAEHAGRLDDPAMSRRVGNLLGNDLGQQRLQFNARTYVVEPAYRDDGLGLWDFTDPPAERADQIEVVVDAMRPQPQAGEAPPRGEPERDPLAGGRAREAASDGRGVVVATYPEWDRAGNVERPAWTTLRDVPPPLGDAARIDALLAARPDLRQRIARLVRGARLGLPARLRRQIDGPDLDLDALLEAAIAMRRGEPPDERIHRDTVRLARDLSVSILLDCSQSTGERVAGYGAGPPVTVLDVQRQAVALLAEATAPTGDPLALRAFASCGRDDVRLFRLKEFSEPWGAPAKARRAGLQPGLSTRLGAALRHAGAELAAARTHRRLILVLTDGEASDIDVADPLDLVEDTRRVSRQLKARGIDVFGVTLDPCGTGAGAAMFGAGNCMKVTRLDDLPARLAELYFRLARR